MKKSINIGIMSKKEFIERTIAIAKGEHVPSKNDPKIWFESFQSMSQVLSNENRALLSLIAKQKPQSIKDLQNISGRKTSNLCRTLKTMQKFGLVELVKNKKEVVPVVKVTSFRLEMDLCNPRMA